MWDLEYLQELDPVDFENLVAYLFNNMGYHTQLTPVSKDGGVDIEVSIEHVGLCHKWLVQAKRYIGNVGVKEVREYCSLKYREHVDGVIIVTTSGFTKEAHEEAVRHNVKLIGGSLLVSMLNHYCPESPVSPVKRAQKNELQVSGESILGRQVVVLEGSRISLAITPKHIYFEKPISSLFSRKSELIRRIDVKDIVGFHEVEDTVFMLLGGNGFEILGLIPQKREAFRSMVEQLRPTYLRGETLLKLEKAGRRFVVLTSRRFVVVGKDPMESLSIKLKAIIGCKEESSGLLLRKKLVILEAGKEILHHEIDVRDTSSWAASIRAALQGR